MHEAEILRLLRFRTVRGSFDAALRSTVLPGLRARPEVLAVRAGRQGPEETGLRVLASVWASRAAMEAALGEMPEGAESGAENEIVEATVEVLPILTHRLEMRPLGAGILRLAQGRASKVGLAALTELALRDLADSQASDAGPADLVVAGAEDGAFVSLSTWPDWASIEVATGATVSEPLRNKRAADLDIFHVDHLELVGHRPESA